MTAAEPEASARSSFGTCGSGEKKTKDRWMTEPKTLYTNQQNFDMDWGVVTAGWIAKYPNPDLKQVRSVETVQRVICEDTKEMFLHRVFDCAFKLPKMFGGLAHVVCVEESHFDLERRTLTIHGRNETLGGRVRVHEICTYTEVAPGQTRYTQQASCSHRDGMFSGVLMPVAEALAASICQRHISKGSTAVKERSKRELSLTQLAVPTGVMCETRSGQSVESAGAQIPAWGALAALGLLGGVLLARRS
eukprot:gnl/TRDRNA2_/TRDRNA2_33683_c0_seq1.p1 gnl/TRDRNA2_/TRDRNA2_33683_c0~~gnl/TRDRNA2_/TRDRNA2_33683_c0_seq1.p1  ORF type:complete len:285 (+),score=40.11 gnl/TRDRNA2_/TRDRNA2_33683_c0_seq1:112-855(+)